MSTRSTKSRPLTLGGEPTVNLLPAEVVARGAARRTRRVLGALVIGSLVVVGAGYGAALSRAAAAQIELADAQDRTQDLLAEQLEYVDATTTTKLVASARNARTLGSSTEILWDDVVDTVESYLPEGAAIQSATMVSRVPWGPELVPTGPLREPLVATLTFEVTSPAQLDVTGVVRSLRGMTGFADASPDSVIAAGDVFTTTITLNLNTEALAARFAAENTEDAE